MRKIYGAFTTRPVDLYESKINEFRLKRNMTYREIFSLTGVREQRICSLANGLESPLNRKGEIKKVAQLIADILLTTVEELFPAYFCSIVPRHDLTNDQIFDITYGENKPDVFNEINGAEFWIFVHRMIKREKRKHTLNVIELIYKQNHTLLETANILGVSLERIRQANSYVLRVLRHPSIRKHIQEFFA